MTKLLDLRGQLGIRNFRSFGDKGIYLNPLSKINLLIGKNNCGKSNVLKFLQSLAAHNGAWGSFPGNEEDKHKDSTRNPSIFFYFSRKELGWPEAYSVRNSTGQPYSKPMEWALEDRILMEYEFGNNTFSMSGWKAQGNMPDGQYVYFNKDEVALPIVNRLEIQTYNDNHWKQIEGHYKTIFDESLRAYLSKIIYIPDFREIVAEKKPGKSRFTSTITAQNIIAEMHRMKNPDVGEAEKKEQFEVIETKISSLLECKSLSIEIPHTLDKMILNMDGNRLALENLGTGIHEIVLLCSALMLHSKHLVCIEEPEIHLHPTLQRKFIRFLQQADNQYLLAIHSNVFLDETGEGLSIFHLQYDKKQTTVDYRRTSSEICLVIDDLGYKASDLLQTNGIIWVEGPSDRIFLGKWLEMMNSIYKEGVHYSIMFYGGKLLAHVGFASVEEQLIDLLRINRNAFVLIDRDSVKRTINATKERIADEIGNDRCWITQGREIENYLSKDTINAWLAMHGGGSVKITKPGQKFDKLVMDAQPELIYGKRKAAYSGEIRQCIRPSDLDELDLRERLERVLDSIRSWNER